jgi:hypothetical protein
MTDLNSTDRDVSRAIRSWLHEDRHEDASRLAGAVLDNVDVTPQRRAGWLAWRPSTMNKFLTLGLGAAAVVVLAVLIGSQLGDSPGGLGGPGDTPSADADPTATPEASPSATSSPETGLPEGPMELGWDGMPESAPRLTVTIPAAGWAEPDDGILMKGEEVDNVPEAAVITFSEPAGTDFYVYGDPCRWQSTTPETPATTVDEIAAALAAQASRDASEPVDITVGGYEGKSVTLHVPDDATFDECEGPEFATFGTQSDDLARYQQGPGQIDELWIVDVDGAIVIIDAMYRGDTPDEVIGELRSIAESVTFELP